MKKQEEIQYLDKDRLMIKTVPDIDVKNYEDFKNKWCRRRLYSLSNNDRSGGASIDLLQNRPLNLSHYTLSKPFGDLMFTPSEIGWASEKQRREFYKDAKKAGVVRMAGSKNIWYKLIELKEITQ